MNIDCSKFEANVQRLCVQARNVLVDVENDVDKRLDDVQMQIWIVSGVCGGVALILIIALIALVIQLSGLRQRVNYLGGNSGSKPKPPPEHSREIPKHENQESTTHLRQQPHHSYAQAPKNMTSEEELAQLGFSAYTGHPVDSRQMSTSPIVNSAGGVRVLPRNPPTGFRNNGAYNDGYM